MKGYDAYFVPQFAPWLNAAVAAVTDGAIPAGRSSCPVAHVPELDTLTRHMPNGEIVGIDLSAGMVRRARERATE